MNKKTKVLGKSNNKNDQFDQIIDKLFDADYVPSQLLSKEAFIKKKKMELMQQGNVLTERLIPGITFFSLIKTGSPRIDDLLVNFIFKSDLSKFQGKTLDEIAAMPTEALSYGLQDHDFDLLLDVADQVDEKGLHKEAIMLYKSLTVLFPTHIESYIKWGNVEYQHFDVLEAIKVFEESKKLFDSPTVEFCLGVCKVKIEDFAAAKQHFDTALLKCDEFGDEDIKQKTLEMIEGLKACL